MTPIRTLPQADSHPTCSFLATFSGSQDTYLKQNKSFARYVTYAIQTLDEHNLAPPDADRMTLIVESALVVQSLFFAVCLHHPEPAELHQVFEAFVLSCILPSERRSNP
jgi:hypothetical protein